MYNVCVGEVWGGVADGVGGGVYVCDIGHIVVII